MSSYARHPDLTPSHPEPKLRHPEPAKDLTPRIHQTPRILSTLTTLLTILLLAALTASADEITLVDAGTPTYTVSVLPNAEATPPEPENVSWHDDNLQDDTAATTGFLKKELEHYLAKLGKASTAAGANPAGAAPVSILIGPHGSLGDQAPDGLDGPQSYVIDATPCRVVLSGYDLPGTVYAVYEFLERLGCRWYAPGPEGEIIPQRERVTFPLGRITGKPALRIRGATALTANPDMILWAGRNKLNATFYTDMTRFPLAKLMGFIDFEGGHLSTEMLPPDAPYPFPKEDLYPTSAQGGKDVNNDGTLSYYEAHPEWFGYSKEFSDRDVWRPDDPRGGTIMRNFCISNPHAREVWVGNSLEYIRKRPYLDMVFIDLNDTPKFCECAECARQKPADWNLLLMCQLAKAVEAEGLPPKVGVNFYTYTRTDEPPSAPLDLTPEEYSRLQPSYAPIRRCFAHGVVDDNCWEPLSPAESNRNNAQFFDSWSKAGWQGNYMIVDYINRAPWLWLPALVDERFAQDFLDYQRLDVMDGWMAFGVRPPFGAKTFDYWYFAKLCDKGAEAAENHEAYFEEWCRNWIGAEQADALNALIATTRKVFSNISYFCNRPHSIYEGLVALQSPGLLRAESLAPEERIWNPPFTDIEQLFPFAHLSYAARQDAGSNALDLEEMRPLLDQMRQQLDAMVAQTPEGAAAARWEMLRAQLAFGEQFSRLLLAIVDAYAAALQNDASGVSTQLQHALNALASLEAPAYSEYWTWAKEGPWRVALQYLLEQHPQAAPTAYEEFQFLPEQPRQPGGGPPPERPRGR